MWLCGIVKIKGHGEYFAYGWVVQHQGPVNTQAHLDIPIGFLLIFYLQLTLSHSGSQKSADSCMVGYNSYYMWHISNAVWTQNSHDIYLSGLCLRWQFTWMQKMSSYWRMKRLYLLTPSGLFTACTCNLYIIIFLSSKQLSFCVFSMMYLHSGCVSAEPSELLRCHQLIWPVLLWCPALFEYAAHERDDESDLL